MKGKAYFFNLIMVVFAIVVLQWGLSSFAFRIDLTADQRFTLSPQTKATLEKVKSPIEVDVLLGGDLPPAYRRLRTEMEQLLRSIHAENDFIYFNIVDPFAEEEDPSALVEQLYAMGLTPEIEVDENDPARSQSLFVPWMILNQNKQSVKVSLLKKNLGDLPEERVQQSIQNLEYSFMEGLFQLQQDKDKSIAVMGSHDGSSDIEISNFLQGLLPFYRLAKFDLKAFPDAPEKTLENLQRFDLVFWSNPKEELTEEEKFIFDQYTVNGGNSLLLFDAVTLSKDSLFNFGGKAVAYPAKDLFAEFLFPAGLRVSTDLLTDLYAAPIVLAQGDRQDTQYRPFPWSYYPLPEAENGLIGAGTGPLQFRFASTIDTLYRKGLTKTVLVQSSNRSKVKKTPRLVSLEEATTPVKPSTFSEGPFVLGVLVEGEFQSRYKNRISPIKGIEKQKQGKAKMIVISDGNFAESQLDKGQPLELGYDKWTNNFYSNKSFLTQCVHYLMGNDDLLSLKQKEIRLAFLDPQRLIEKANTMRYSAMSIPLVLLIGLAGAFHRYRKKYFSL